MSDTEYKIITVSKHKGDEAATALSMQVQAFLNEGVGWKLQGGVSVTSYQHDATSSITRMAQALVRSKSGK